jgi:hypothetical protein
VTAWSVQMTIVVDDERWDVLEVEQQLMKAVAVVDSRPRFVTAQHWYRVAMDELKRQPAVSQNAAQGTDWMPRGNTKRRRMGAGPSS